MNRQDTLSSFFDDPNLLQTLLALPERELVRAILRHADDCSQGAQTKRCVEQTLSRAIGEIILQRATERLGTSALETIRRELHSGNIRDAERTTFAGPPTPAPSPHPPSPAPAPSPHTNLRKYDDISAGPPSPAPSPHPPSPSPTGPHHSLRAMDASRFATLPSQLSLHADCVVLDEFLAPTELQDLTRFVLDHESKFRTSEVISPGVGGVIDPEHRRSRVLVDLAHFEGLMFQRIQSALPIVLGKLDMATFAITRFESQITASNDGDFFRHHTDNAEEEISSRHLTFVYFFHREPKAFQGGELRMHDSRLESGIWQRTGDGKTVIPEQNQIVFFPSDLLHEISPVVCPSQAFADSRFTVNGWLHR